MEEREFITLSRGSEIQFLPDILIVLIVLTLELPQQIWWALKFILAINSMPLLLAYWVALTNSSISCDLCSDNFAMLQMKAPWAAYLFHWP